MKMTTSLLLPSLALVLFFLLLTSEARRTHDESNTGDLNRHHRHRHRHEISRLGIGNIRKRPIDDIDDYESDLDYEEYTDNEDSTEDEDYSIERHNSRLYPPKRNGNNHHRYEPRYTSRYYHRGSSYHSGTGRTYEARGHDARSSHHNRARTVHRKRYEDSDEDYNDRPTRRRFDDEYDDNDQSYYYNKHKGLSSRKRYDIGESSKRRSKYEPKKDWRYKIDEEEDEYAYDADDEYEDENDDEEENDRRSNRKYAARKAKTYQEKTKSENDRDKSTWRTSNSKFDEWMKRTRSSLSNVSRSYEPLAKKRNSHQEEDDDEDEVELWKDDEEDDKELDNDFYKNDESALKTYDDIIRRLTEDGATTTAPTTPIKRDYRNTDIESHLRRDAYGNLKFYDTKKNNTSFSNQFRYRSNSGSKNFNLVDVGINSRKDLTVAATVTNAKKKSLEEDKDNIKEDEDSDGIQADANTDYADDETEDDDTLTTTSPSTTSTTSTTTTTTTTTKRPILNTRYRDTARGYEAVSTGTQYNGYQGKNDYPSMSAYSALKWQQLGTRESVKETRNNMSQFKNGKSAEMTAAHVHAMRVAKEGGCQWPRAKVISVRDLYPNSTATYIPHCAILHRCSDDTGCCRSETLTCEAKQTQRVELYFYAYIHGKTEIEKLSFNNHTECECRDRKDFASTGDRLTEHRSARHFPYSSTAPQNIVRPTRKPCRCPSHFTPNMTFDGVCECNCVEGHDDCEKLQRGKGYLSWSDRICIQKEQCTPPNCSYGTFSTGQGRCPKKKDMFGTTHRTNFNHHHLRRS